MKFKRIGTAIVAVTAVMFALVPASAAPPSSTAQVGAHSNSAKSVLPYTCNGSTSVSWSTSETKSYSITSGFCLRLYGVYYTYNLDLQRDGNLVLYNTYLNRATWATGTNGKGASYLMLSSSGSIEIFDKYGFVLWTNYANLDRIHPGMTTNFKLEIGWLSISNGNLSAACPEDDYLVLRNGLVYPHDPKAAAWWSLWDAEGQTGQNENNTCNWLVYK